MSAARCTATRQNGEPCQAYATRTGLCAGHSHLGVSRNPAAFQKLAAEKQRNKADTRNRTAKDWIALKLEAKAEELVDAVVETGRKDWRAFAWLFETVYGKPETKLAVSTPDNMGDVAALSPAERREMREAILRQHPELAELIPRADKRPGQRAGGDEAAGSPPPREAANE